MSNSTDSLEFEIEFETVEEREQFEASAADLGMSTDQFIVHLFSLFKRGALRHDGGEKKAA